MNGPSVRLHGYPVSNYFNIVRAALLEKCIPFEVVMTRASQDEAMLSRSPMGKIPFLETSHGWLAETVAILEFLEDEWPSPPLHPASAYDRARARQIINVLQLYVEGTARSLYPGVFMGASNDPIVVAASRQALERAAAALMRLVYPQPFLLGDKLTFADLFAYYCLDPADRVTRCTYGFSLVERLRLTDWASRLSERQSTRIVTSDFRRVFPSYLAEKGAGYRDSLDFIGEATSSPSTMDV